MGRGDCKNCGENKQLYSGGLCRRCFHHTFLINIEKDKGTTFQRYLYCRLKSKCNFPNKKIPISEFKKILSCTKLPHNIHHEFLKEMEEAGFIKKRNQKTITLK